MSKALCTCQVFFERHRLKMEKEASKHACVDGKTELICEKDGHHRTWRLASKDETPSDAEAVCPAMSIPWRQHAFCDGISSSEKCYITEQLGETKSVAVCLHQIDKNHPMQYTTWSGMQSLRKKTPVSFDRPVQRSEVDKTFEPCVVHKFGDASNTAVVGYTPKGDKAACSNMLQNAFQVCEHASSAEECKMMVHSVHPNPGESEGCTLQTHDIPIAHQYDKGEWFRWVRENSYSCKAAGWMCSAEDMKDYKAPACERDEDCRASVEVGICDMKNHVCAVGSGQGKHCTKHEDCDILNRVEGACSAGSCKSGNTGVDATYIVPKSCDRVSSDSLYTYCGETRTANGDTLYTGVCTEYTHKGKEYRGCKAFTDYTHIERTRATEHDWQAHHRPYANFYVHSPPWEQLDTCPSDKRVVVNGRSTCETTTDRIRIRTSDKTCDMVLPFH